MGWLGKPTIFGFPPMSFSKTLDRIPVFTLQPCLPTLPPAQLGRSFQDPPADRWIHESLLGPCETQHQRSYVVPA